MSSPRKIDKIANSSDFYAREFPSGLTDLFTLANTPETCLPSFPDVEFWVGPKSTAQQRIYAHRSVLSRGNAYFQSLFLKNSSLKSIQETEFSASSFASFVKLFYTGRITLSEDSVEEFLQISCKYQCSELRDFCASFLRDRITQDNVTRYLQLSQTHDCPNLLSHCADFLSLHINEENAVETLGIAMDIKNEKLKRSCLNCLDVIFSQVAVNARDLAKLTWRAFEEILSRDTLGDSEIFLFETLLRWFDLRKDQGENQAHLDYLLTHIRFPLMSFNDLSKRVETTGRVSADILKDAYRALAAPSDAPFACKPRIGRWRWEDSNPYFQTDFRQHATSLQTEAGWHTLITCNHLHSSRNIFTINFEKLLSNSYVVLGICPESERKNLLDSYCGAVKNTWGLYCLSGELYLSGARRKFWSTGGLRNGDVLTLSVNFNTRDVEFFVNYASLGVAFQLPATGGPFFPCISVYERECEFIIV